MSEKKTFGGRVPSKTAAPRPESTRPFPEPGVQTGPVAGNAGHDFARMNVNAPIQRNREKPGFGSSVPRFQQMFVSRTGLHGHVLGAREQEPRRERVRVAPRLQVEQRDDQPLLERVQSVQAQAPERAQRDERVNEVPAMKLGPLEEPEAEFAREKPSLQAVHEEVSRTLGIPVNGTNWGNPGGQYARGAGISAGYADEIDVRNTAANNLIGALNTKLGGVPEKDGDERVLHDAAVCSALGVGVCDNFSALTAVKSKLAGYENIDARHSDTHRFTTVAGMEVDPWKYAVHGGEHAAEPYSVSTPFAAGKDSEDVRRDFTSRHEQATTALNELRQGQKHTADFREYDELIRARDKPGDWGTIEMRQKIHDLHTARMAKLRR